MIPVEGLMTLLPNIALTVVVIATAFPCPSATERWLVPLSSGNAFFRLYLKERVSSPPRTRVPARSGTHRPPYAVSFSTASSRMSPWSSALNAGDVMSSTTAPTPAAKGRSGVPGSPGGGRLRQSSSASAAAPALRPVPRFIRMANACFIASTNQW